VKWGGVGVVALFLVAQLVPVDRTNPPVESDVAAPAEVRAILERACFDCHSHETRWPWYSRVAPVSWWVSGHVEAGRRSLNFSRWPTYDFESQDLLFRQIETEITNDAMPLPSYLRGHPEARLSASDRQVILEWVR
jgi:hypothetical protein